MTQDDEHLIAAREVVEGTLLGWLRHFPPSTRAEKTAACAQEVVRDLARMGFVQSAPKPSLPSREDDEHLIAELLPCPFCGGEATTRTYQDESLWSHAIVTKTVVSCDECDIQFDTESGYEFEAPAAWNRRSGCSSPLQPQPSPVSPSREEVVRAICTAGDVHLRCTFPDCTCKGAPRCADAVLALSAPSPLSDRVERLELELADAKSDVLRLHDDKMRFLEALLRIRDMRLGERDPAGDGGTYILRGDEHVALRQIARAALGDGERR